MRLCIKKSGFYILLLCVISNIFSYPIKANDVNNVLIEEELIKVYFTDIYSYNTWLDIDSMGEANVKVSLLSYNGAEVKIKCYLQQSNAGVWRNLMSWSSQNKRSQGQITEKYYVSEGYTYRLKSYVYVYDMKGKLLESASKMSKEIKY